MISKVYNLNKPIGLTPLEILLKFRHKHQIPTSTKLTYVGRLDPMAHGVQLILSHPTVEEVSKLKGLDKEYLCSLVLGISSDSYDLLGMITDYSKNSPQTKLDMIQNVLEKFLGQSRQPYPPYSSPKIKGLSLFEHAKSGTINQIDLPTKLVNIFSINHINLSTIDSNTLIKTAIERVNLVKGDFRQEMIIKKWTSLFDNLPLELPKLTFRINCSSGTYIRGLSHQLGQDLGLGSLLFDLERTRVGNYKIADSLNL